MTTKQTAKFLSLCSLPHLMVHVLFGLLHVLSHLFVVQVFD